MSATIRKIKTKVSIGGQTIESAIYLKLYHTVNCAYIYERDDINVPNSPIEYRFGIDYEHLDKFLALFHSRVIIESEHESDKDMEAIEEWEYWAIRRANMSEPMTKENVLAAMKKDKLK